MFMSGKYGGIMNEAVMTCSKVLYRHLPGRTVKNHKISLVPHPKSEPDTSKYKSQTL
jgi:hypothetical protein